MITFDTKEGVYRSGECWIPLTHRDEDTGVLTRVSVVAKRSGYAQWEHVYTFVMGVQWEFNGRLRRLSNDGDYEPDDRYWPTGIEDALEEVFERYQANEPERLAEQKMDMQRERA